MSAPAASAERYRVLVTHGFSTITSGGSAKGPKGAVAVYDRLGDKIVWQRTTETRGPYQGRTFTLAECEAAAAEHAALLNAR